MKENKLLVLRYFLQLKIKEILIGLFYLAILVGILIIGALLIAGTFYLMNWVSDNFPIITKIFCWIILGLIAFVLIYALGQIFFPWIKDNWEEAKHRARINSR